MQPKVLKQAIFKTSLATYSRAVWNGVNASSWHPLGSKILVLPDQATSKTAGGIELTDDMRERNTMAAEAGVVVAKGPDVTMKIEPGDRVYMERYAGQLVTGHDERVYRLMDDVCIGAVFRSAK